jgi:hypothetical protein
VRWGILRSCPMSDDHLLLLRREAEATLAKPPVASKK